MAVNFQSLDDPEIAASLIDRTQDVATTNFILDFGEDGAYVTFDLADPTVEQLMEHDRPSSLNARWINIWYPQRQRQLLESLARIYDFSPRLLGLMASDPMQPVTPTPSQHPSRKSHKFWNKSPTTSSVEAEAEAASCWD
jgi:hypothetical protein